MTTQVKVELVQFTGYPVVVSTTSGDGAAPVQQGILERNGDAVLVFVHQNQDVVVGELKTGAA
jgi:hypothetical protein